ncbi:MAG: hypothetical protein DI626_11420 [Micavibrio aeruginosavorus]|uniref:Lipoprotein n=1 Tax=Micavibrio aeruginosavorus TaxID=349221 RepID=A0A2W5BFN4_9BACT|nr:MAG: hypothetical protein DI626_11420 [Micavibrio aeruginosavorus]
MKRNLKSFTLGLITCAAFFSLAACGDGALKRQFTVGGVYSICKPDGYPVVCFADADGKDGGLFCMPLSEVGGKCL